MIADIGGLPVAGGGRVRTGLVFRVSGGLTRPEDLEQLEASDLRVVVDMRGDGEDRSLIEAWARGRGVSYRSHPIALATGTQFVEAVRRAASAEEAAEYMRGLYRKMIDEYGQALARTIGALAEDLPAGFGCAAGRDRTGVVAALVHLLLGVPEEEVVRDYVNRAPSPERLRRLGADFGFEESDLALPGIDGLLTVTESTLLETLRHLEGRHGGVVPYLEASGLSPTAVGALRERLIERPD